MTTILAMLAALSAFAECGIQTSPFGVTDGCDGGYPVAVECACNGGWQ